MAAITWQNINAPSGAEALRALAEAQKSLIGGVESTLVAQQAANQGIADRTREAQKQDFLNTLQAAKTPEQLAAMEADGSIAQMLQALDARDQAAVRGSAEARIASLRQNVLAGQEYGQKQRSVAEAPLIEAHDEAVANDQFDVAAQIRNANPGVNWAAKTVAAANQKRLSAELAHKDQLAVINNPVALKQAAFIAEQLPAQQTLAVAELTNKQRLLNEADEDRRLTDRLTEASQSYAQQNTVGKVELGRLAALNGMPVLPNGMPDIANLTERQIAGLNSIANTAGIPGIDALYKGDTTLRDSFLSGLTASGGFTPAALARNAAKINGAFDTTRVGALTGNDALVRDTNAAQKSVIQAEQDSTNWYAPNSPNAQKAYEDLAAKVPIMLDKTTGLGTDEDVADLQALVYRMGTVGLEVSPGKFLVPSIQDMTNAIRTAEGGWFTDAKRAKNAEAILKKSLNTARVDKLLAQAEDSKIANRQKAVRELLNPPTK